MLKRTTKGDPKQDPLLLHNPAALPFGLAHFTPVNRSKILLYFNLTNHVTYVTFITAYRKGDKQLCAKVKLAEVIKRNIDKKGEKMSKIIRLNDETERLLNIVRRNLQDGFDKANMHNCDDILKNDNIVIQSALRTAIEFNTYLVESK